MDTDLGTVVTPGKPRNPLDRNTWVRGAIDILSEEGIVGLRIEVLAKRFNVTKGSFYWHFQDRNDLLSAVLHTWKKGRIRDIAKQTHTEAGQALQQIHHVIRIYSEHKNRRGMRIELAVRDWARHHPGAAETVAEVDEARLRHARDLFVACGMSLEEATSRSMLLYAYVFGISMMNFGHMDAGCDISKTKRDIASFITQ